MQLEDHSATPITKKQLANLPIMAFREEFSSFLIFKGGKGLKTTLTRMCQEEDEDDFNNNKINYTNYSHKKYK